VKIHITSRIGKNILTIRLLVIADGVGSWNKYKIDPKLYSNEICKHVSENFHQYELALKIREKFKHMTLSSDFNYDYDSYKDSYSETIVKKLLIQSANMTKSKGSSTCTILLMDKLTGRLFTSYIGDSLYLIARNINGKYQAVLKSKEQMHDFLTPFQVGNDSNEAKEALSNSFALQNNDVIILASDG
jgi:serine/threonine protein phosphatase PrpC